MRSTRRGQSTLPPLAIAAVITAICSGVTEIGPWPMQSRLAVSPLDQPVDRGAIREECRPFPGG